MVCLPPWAGHRPPYENARGACYYYGMPRARADSIILEPGSPEWMREMTASKMSAVVGLSPYESPFSLWCQMAGWVIGDPPTPSMLAGHYLEDAVCRWVADQHGLVLRPGGCWRSRARPWQVASPDRRALEAGARPGRYDHERIAAVVEAKAAADYEYWGPDGSDDIPGHYRVQALWQCDTLGVDTAYVGVLLPRHEFRSYVLHPNEGEVEFLRAEARQFLDSLIEGVPPNVDAHSSTYAVLRQLNPNIEDRQEELPRELAAEYTSAVLRLRAAEQAHARARARVAAAVGTARAAVHGGKVLARRQTNGSGTPYLVAASRLSLIEGEVGDEQEEAGSVGAAEGSGPQASSDDVFA